MAPRVGEAGVGGEVADRVAQLLVGRPAERGGLHLPRLPRRGGHTGQRSERLGCGEPGAAVPDLGRQPGRAQGLGAREGQEDVRVGVLTQQGGDVAVEGVDLGDDRGQRGHERAGHLGGRGAGRAGRAGCGGEQVSVQGGGVLAAGVADAAQPRGQAGRGEPVGVVLAGEPRRTRGR